MAEYIQTMIDELNLKLMTTNDLNSKANLISAITRYQHMLKKARG